MDLEYFFKLKQYKRYSLNRMIVEKSFNHGNGSLALFRFYEEKKIILINKTMVNKSDMKHLKVFIEKNNMSDYQLVEKEYGYPDYYFKTFSL